MNEDFSCVTLIWDSGDGNIVFFPAGDTVGCWHISGRRNGDVMFASKRRPNWFRRLMTRLLFGWVWFDKLEPGSGLSEPTLNGEPWPVK